MGADEIEAGAACVQVDVGQGRERGVEHVCAAVRGGGRVEHCHPNLEKWTFSPLFMFSFQQSKAQRNYSAAAGAASGAGASPVWATVGATSSLGLSSAVALPLSAGACLPFLAATCSSLCGSQ